MFAKRLGDANCILVSSWALVSDSSSCSPYLLRVSYRPMRDKRLELSVSMWSPKVGSGHDVCCPHTLPLALLRTSPCVMLKDDSTQRHHRQKASSNSRAKGPSMMHSLCVHRHSWFHVSSAAFTGVRESTTLRSIAFRRITAHWTLANSCVMFRLLPVSPAPHAFVPQQAKTALGGFRQIFVFSCSEAKADRSLRPSGIMRGMRGVNLFVCILLYVVGFQVEFSRI